MTIFWGWFESPFGPAIVMGTEKGICGMGFAAEMGAETAFEDLVARWPKASYVEDPVMLRPWVLQAFGAKDGALDTTPLFLIGAPFQIKVWEALLSIPTGHVTTYSEIAQAVGAPRAVRAVGTAVGRNPISWIIPCHRALRKSGGLGGYHWGIPMKRAMLAYERSNWKRKVYRRDVASRFFPFVCRLQIPYMLTDHNAPRPNGDATEKAVNMRLFSKPVALAMAGVLSLAACTDPAQLNQSSNMSNTQQGALIGAGAGALAGALSRGDGNRDKGAVIGAVVGGAIGAGIGYNLDQQEAELRRDLGNDDVEITNTGDRLIVSLPQDLLFATDSFSVRPDLQNDLYTVAGNLQNYPASTIQVIGHTDSDGDAAYNQQLSERGGDLLLAY